MLSQEWNHLEAKESCQFLSVLDGESLSFKTIKSLKQEGMLRIRGDVHLYLLAVFLILKVRIYQIPNIFPNIPILYPANPI